MKTKSITWPFFLLAATVQGQIDQKNPTFIAPVLIKAEIIDRNVLPESLFKGQISQQVAGVKDQMIKAGRDQEDMQFFLADLEKQLNVRERKFSMTLQSDHGKIYYDLSPIGKSAGDPGASRKIIYFNGNYTYRFMDHGIKITKGRDFSDIQYFPTLGNGLLDVPLFRSAEAKPSGVPPVSTTTEVLIPQPRADGFGEYVPAFLEGGVPGEPKRIASFSLNKPWMEYILTDYAKVGDLRLARKLVRTEFYVEPGASEPSSTKRMVTTFDVKEINATELNFGPPDFLKLLRPGDSVWIHDEAGDSQYGLSSSQPELRKYFEPDKTNGPELPRVLIGATTTAVLLGLAYLTRYAMRPLKRGPQ
jgi:hypothetical protein